MKIKQERTPDGKYICPVCNEPVDASRWAIFKGKTIQWGGLYVGGWKMYDTGYYAEYIDYYMHRECWSRLQAEAQKEAEMRKRGIYPELLKKEWKCTYCETINPSNFNFCGNCGAPRKR